MHIFPSKRKAEYGFLKDRAEWWTVYVVDLLAVPGAIVAARLNRSIKAVTPNALSLVSFVLFFVGVALMFARPRWGAFYTAMFFLSFVFDAADGKVARLIGQRSDFGEIVDAFFDMLNHALGLSLVGVAMSLKADSIWPAVLIVPYAISLGMMHVNHITSVVAGEVAPPPQDSPIKTRWEKFCDKRGLDYHPYGQVERIYFSILLVGVNLTDPTIFLLVAVYLPFVPEIFRRLRDYAAAEAPGEDA